MITREDALGVMLSEIVALGFESVPTGQSVGRVVAHDIVARITQPPSDMSAMDGYAVRFEDAAPGAELRIIDAAPAGRPSAQRLSAGEAVRVFTGSVIPQGADHVVIQEDVDLRGEVVVIAERQPAPRNIRRAGIDFRVGDVLIEAGTRIGPAEAAVIAAANIGTVSVRRRPRIALLASGDELRAPGADLKPGEIISSTPHALSAFIESWGAVAHDLGVARDTPEAIRERIDAARDADLVVPLGGASVGDHDLMRPTFQNAGYGLRFEKVAVRPGKPTWFGVGSRNIVLGLPGNPASAIVCALLFLKPVILAMSGRSLTEQREVELLPLAEDLPANGRRETFLRAKSVETDAYGRSVQPARDQDSSLLSPFLSCDLLLQRPVDAASASRGDLAPCLKID